MNNLQKLTDLLCELKEIKEDIMELRFGTIIILKDYIGEKKITLGSDIYYSSFQVIFTMDNQSKYFTRDDIQTVIGNPIEYHHLMMYSKQKGLKLLLCDGNIFKVDLKKDGETWKTNVIEVINFNSSFPLHKQSEEVLGALVEYLNNLK